MTATDDLIKALRHAAVNGPAVVTPEMLTEAADLIERLTADSSLASIRALQEEWRVKASMYETRAETTALSHEAILASARAEVYDLCANALDPLLLQEQGRRQPEKRSRP